MKVIGSTGENKLATLYIAEFEGGKRLEFVESLQPPLTREKKWVILVSTLYGCPVTCKICDCGEQFYGKPEKEDILQQIEFLVKKRFPDNLVNSEKFKIQFARMGEPAFNNAVLDVLRELPGLYPGANILPSVSTIAPAGRDDFFKELIDIKNDLYENFQMQFSVHTTDTAVRDWLLPVKKWGFAKIAEYGKKFKNGNDKKITLNFAMAKGIPVDTDILLRYFSPDIFLIKATPLNPTYTARIYGLETLISNKETGIKAIRKFEDAGYQVLLSIGEWEENKIGTNCGQYLRKHLQTEDKLKEAYTYDLQYDLE